MIINASFCKVIENNNLFVFVILWFVIVMKPIWKIGSSPARHWVRSPIPIHPFSTIAARIQVLSGLTLFGNNISQYNCTWSMGMHNEFRAFQANFERIGCVCVWGGRAWGGGGYARHSWTYLQDFQPTCKTFNFLIRLPTYIQDFQLTYKTSIQPHTRLPTYIQDFQLTYKTFSKLLYQNTTANQTSNQHTGL